MYVCMYVYVSQIQIQLQGSLVLGAAAADFRRASRSEDFSQDAEIWQLGGLGFRV